MKALRGRLIAELIPLSHKRASGLYVVDRKNTSLKARVIEKGADSLTVKGKPKTIRAQAGDIIHFKKYSCMPHRSGDREGFKEGLMTIWFEDIVAYEPKGGDV